MHRSLRYIALSMLIGALLIGPTVSLAAAEVKKWIFRRDIQCSPALSRRKRVRSRGDDSERRDASAQREAWRDVRAEAVERGDEVVVVLDENNYIVDMHLKGKEGTHQIVTGKLIHVGMVNKEIKLQTDDGEKVFPLTEQGQKTKGIPDGALVTVELNEAGAVIDVHRASTGSGKH